MSTPRLSEKAEEVLEGVSIELESERLEDTTRFTLTDSLGVVQTTFELLNDVEKDSVLSEVATTVVSATPTVLFQYLQELIERNQTQDEEVFDAEA